MGKLTVRGIEALKPREKPYKIVDGDGLQLRIATDGDKTWLVRYIVGGNERQYRLPKPYRAAGGEGFYTLQEAREESAKIRAMARQGIDYQIKLQTDADEAEQQRLAEIMLRAEQAKAENADRLTIRDMFEVWIRDGVRRRDENAELLRSFKADLLPFIGDHPVKLVTENGLRNVLRQLVERGVNRSAVVMSNNLTQMFAWAEKRQPWRRLLIDGNPMDLIEIEKIVSPDFDMDCIRTRKLSEDEIRELRSILDRMRKDYEAASDKRSADRPLGSTVQCAIWIMLSTVCRVGELSMARWEHINFDEKTWFIPKKNVKGRMNDFLIFLSEFSIKAFRELHALTGTSEWCFPAKNNDGHIDVKTISKQIGDRQARFKKDRMGNPRKPMSRRKHDDSLVLGGGANGEWTPHDLRRTGTTIMQSQGVSLDVIDRCQNHVLPGSKVRRPYLLYEYEDNKKHAWSVLSDRLHEILNG